MLIMFTAKIIEHKIILKVNKKITNFKKNNCKIPSKTRKTVHVLIAEKRAIIFVSADF